jgi:asparagine N-glycosylation enzyme membrane subunit Stt3
MSGAWGGGVAGSDVRGLVLLLKAVGKGITKGAAGAAGAVSGVWG